MEDNGMHNERKGTGRSAAGLLVIVVLIIALFGAIAWAFSQPGFMEELANVLVITVVVLVIIIIIAYVAYAVLAVAYYASKGEVVQKGVDHSIDDVRGVEGRTLDENGDDIVPEEKGRN